MSWARPTASAGPRTLPGHGGSAGRSEGGRLLEFVDRGACGPVAGRLRRRRRRTSSRPEAARCGAQPAWPFWGRGQAQRRARPDSAGDDAELARSLGRARGRRDRDVAPGRRRTTGPRLRRPRGREPAASCTLSVTGFGRDHPLSSLKCYEPIVMAKIGGLTVVLEPQPARGPVVRRPRRTARSAPRQLALARVSSPRSIERESSGVGQRVDTTLVQGVLAHDTWNWSAPGAHPPRTTRRAPPRRSVDEERLAPNHAFVLPPPDRAVGRRSVDAVLADDRQALWQAFLRVTELEWTLDRARARRRAGQRGHRGAGRVLGRWRSPRCGRRPTTSGSRSSTSEPDVWAEMFRHGTELLHHPQLVADEPRRHHRRSRASARCSSPGPRAPGRPPPP